MKKTILYSILAVMIIVSITAFKNSGNDKKEFLTIFYSTVNKDIQISSSDGTFKVLEYEKRRGVGDQTLVLKLLSDYESQGYKLVEYDFETGAQASGNTVITVLLSK